jgi:plastocyanin
MLSKNDENNKAVLATLALMLLSLSVASSIAISAPHYASAQGVTVQGGGGNATNATMIGGGNATTIIIPQGASTNQTVPSGIYYQPVNATIPAGTTVTWINQDIAAHTATSGNSTTGPSGEFDTGLFSPGQSASATITSQAGTTIPYYCTVHPWMTATITVVATNATNATTVTNQTQ